MDFKINENRLIKLEGIIARGKRSFIEVGVALAEIRDTKLYPEKFKTFEQYCREKWGFTRFYAYRLTEAAQVVKMLPMGNKIENERQARELSKVEPAQRVSVLNSAKKESGEKPLTAASIKMAASQCPPRKKDFQRDKTKTPQPIPPEILDVWNQAEADSNRVLGLVSSLRAALREAQENDNPSFAETDFTDNLAKLDTIFSDLKRVKPHAVCFDCNGVNFKDCSTCKKRGWISKFFYDACVPEEKKKITKR